MYSMTYFEWKGGLKNIPVPAFETGENEPSLVIKSLSMGVESDRRGFMEIEFALDNGNSMMGHYLQNKISAFVHTTVNNLGFGGYSSCGYKFSFSLPPVSGESLTESMMKKYLLLLKLCGVYTFAAPRIVTETFTGNYRGDLGTIGSGTPYGKHLMEKCLRDQIAAA